MTLVEVLVGLVIIAILGAVVYPVVAGQLRKGQTTALGNQFDNYRSAIQNYRQNVQRYPSTLSQLTNALGVGVTDACGGGVPLANRNMWRGPYLTQNITGNTPVGDATVLNALTRDPPDASGGPIGTLKIEAQNVDNSVAIDLEARFDGNNDLNAGTIIWIATTGALGTLTFQIPIRGC